MTAAMVSDGTERTVTQADALLARGEVREAIELLTRANRRARSRELERALVRIRRDGCAALPAPTAPVGREPIVADPHGGTLFEIGPAELTLSSLRAGFAQSGCVLVRGLVPSERVAPLVAGVDATFAAYDASAEGTQAVDSDWFSPFAMPDLISAEGAGQAVVIAPGSPLTKAIPVRAHRRLSRTAGGVWMADSPRMLFEFFELVDDLGIGSLMTAFLGERPLLSANKCNVRTIPPEEMSGGWHQDGAFLGDQVGAFNVWIALSRCGRDAPGLDIVPKCFDRVLESGGEKAYFKWSLSDDDVLAAADGTPIVRPEFEAGDALLFDHRLVHRTGTSPEMTLERHAIESWFFAPSAFPASQLPLVY